MADDEVGARDPADAPSQGGAHSGARAAVLAGVAAGAADRGDVQADVATGAARDGPVASRGVRNQVGPVRAAHGADGAAASDGDQLERGFGAAKTSRPSRCINIYKFSIDTFKWSNSIF